VGVVFVGLPSFTARLRGNEAEVRQVRDRIKVKLELRSYTASDAEAILDKNWAGLNGLTKTFYKESQGSIRILSGLIYNAKRIIASPKNQGKALDEKVIQKAASMLDIRAQI
jgi:DNA transposition AAA+ family ATPase